jgi:hypothetical protein
LNAGAVGRVTAAGIQRQNMSGFSLERGHFCPLAELGGAEMGEKGRTTDSGMAFARREWRMK